MVLEHWESHCFPFFFNLPNFINEKIYCCQSLTRLSRQNMPQARVSEIEGNIAVCFYWIHFYGKFYLSRDYSSIYQVSLSKNTVFSMESTDVVCLTSLQVSRLRIFYALSFHGGTYWPRGEGNSIVNQHCKHCKHCRYSLSRSLLNPTDEPTLPISSVKHPDRCHCSLT